MKLPDLVLMVDTETSGLEPPEAKLLEIGATLYSMHHQSAVFSVDLLLRQPEDFQNGAERVNKIPSNLLLNCSTMIATAGLEMLVRMQQASEFFMAHNVEFDRRFLDGPAWNTRPWVCTKVDFSFQRARPGLSLRDLALEYGVGISTAHRALADVHLMCEIFSRMTRDELATEWQLALRPKNEYRAVINFDQNPLARENGFRFDPARKVWVKRMAEADTASLPFEVIRTKASLVAV